MRFFCYASDGGFQPALMNVYPFIDGIKSLSEFPLLTEILTLCHLWNIFFTQMLLSLKTK